jgi:methylenetetrahydrofolate reductase (NADPH)
VFEPVMARNRDVSTIVKSLLQTTAIEVIPLRGAESQIGLIPVDTTVTITCSPKFGLERTLAHVEAACASGRRVVPHLAARMIGSRAELRELVKRIGDLGVDDLYVVGGDAEEPLGPYYEADELLRDLHDMENNFSRLGVGCYPEGHPNISADALADALVRKQERATYMVSQLCFDPAVLLAWIRQMRSLGVELPLRIGLAGPLQSRKLVELALKIGVGSSIKFLTKQNGIVGNLLLGRAYDPSDLVAAVVGAPDFEQLKIEGFHVFSFNQVGATVGWLTEGLDL